jgi:hypothetical protein
MVADVGLRRKRFHHGLSSLAGFRTSPCVGTIADHDKAQVLPAGSFFALSPGSAHYFFADEDTVIQFNSTGPWGINYINPKDDPRPKM